MRLAHRYFYRLRARIHRVIIINSKNKPYYYWLYLSYWHYRFFSSRKRRSEKEQYIASRPNPGAGIGHQMANWLSGLKISRHYGLPYATYPFSDLSNPLIANSWDSFLGMNDGMQSASVLYQNGWKKVLLPKIDFSDLNERRIIQNIIDSYRGSKVVFLLEMDQFAGSELESVDFLITKYWKSTARNNDNVIFDKTHYNVAIHIRRGDIVQNTRKIDENLSMRWLDVDYYKRVLGQYLCEYSGSKEVDLYIFSQAPSEELAGFEQFGTVYLCNEWDAMKSFLHMANADMLVMSRSGMSYQAAKLNTHGIIIYPAGFWREPIKSERWILSGD